MKANFTYIMRFIMIFFVPMQFAWSQQIVTLAPTLNVCPGTQEVQVPITVQNFAAVNSISLSLEFNNNNITYVSYSVNPALQGDESMLIVNCPPPYNKVKAAYFGITPVSLPNDAVLFTLTFNVNGSSFLNWDVYTPGACQYSDYNAEPLPATFLNGYIGANLPDATFYSTPQICEGDTSTVIIEFYQGEPPFIFTYNNGLSQVIVDTSLTYTFSFNQVLYTTTTWNLVSIIDATGCANNYVNKNTTTYVAPLANQFNVFGGGTRCENGESLAVNLDGSQPGLTYWLYLDNNPTYYWQYGTGDTLYFTGLTAWGIYTIVAQNDCGNQGMNESASITVWPLPEVSFNPLAPVCYLSQPFLLTEGSPLGGLYSGPGVVNGYYDTEIFGPGTYTLTYTYTDVNGCSNSAYQDISVNGLPVVYFYPLPPVCDEGDSTILLGEPAGGTFSGEGVIEGVFYPGLAGSGLHILTYTYTNTEGCTNTATQEVSVMPLPEVNISPVNNLCANASPVSLEATPSGGWFSGSGVVGDVFYPEIATAGTWTLTYSYTNESGCVNTATTNVTVMPVPVLNIEAAGPFCLDAPAVALTASPVGGVFSGEGVQNGYFYPEVAGYGTWPVIYYYTDENGCSSSIGTDITVYMLPEVYMYPIDPVCVTGNPVSLYGWPENGTFTGPGIEVNNFNPAIAGVGTFSIVYTFTNNEGCSNTSVQEVTVYGSPQADFDLPAMVCVNSNAFQLFPVPEGGWFEGTGIYGNWFYPAEAGVGIHQIIYHYSDMNSCNVDVAHQINVLALPIIEIENVDPVCVNASAIELSAVPEGGIFSGEGVINGFFYPAETGPGQWPVTYSFTNNEGCTSSEVIYITVNDLPQPYIEPVNPLCLDASPVELQAWPAGGTFSGTGVENNMFYPNIAGIGTFSITYVYISEEGCSGSSSIDITVNTVTTVDFSLPVSICINGEAFELSGTPAGGWFEGNGVYGNWFYPYEAGAGTWSITYHYQDNNCSASASHEIIVYPAPEIEFPPLGPFCVSAETVTLYATPEGGIFSGTGVLGNTFAPALAGPGNFEITYSVTNEYQCTATSSIWIVVNDLPQVGLYGPENLCINAEPAELSGYPEGGIFSGEGLEGHFFNPALVQPGSHIIAYTYTSAEGCSNFASITINVHPQPEVVINNVPPLCVNGDAVELIASPTGGVFTGTGVWDNYFYPDQAGVGAFIVYYSFTDDYGCSNAGEITVTVNTTTSLTFDALPDICINAAPIQLTAYPSGGTFSGNGVSGDLFDPALAGLGASVITYTYVNEYNCSSSLEQVITVNYSAEVTFNPLPDVCVNGGIVSLIAFPEGGTFSGDGVVDATFNPAIVGPGTYTITYNYTSSDLCQGSASQTINVLPLPEITFNLSSQVCINADPVALVAFPEGGVFTGEGVFNDFFYPDMAGAGTWPVTYSVTNTDGCVSEATRLITVNPITMVNITPVPPVCLYTPSLSLSATPEGGYFSGDGVVDGLFIPSNVGVGSWTVTYTFVNEFGCTSENSLVIDVVPAPEVTILAVDPVCANTEAFVVAAYPEGGSFSGAGMTGNVFNPAAVGAGEWLVTYSFTDLNGCTAETSTVITVNPNTEVTIGSFGPLCQNSSPVILTASPEGGIFSGTGVVDNLFDPAGLAPGTYTILYTWDGSGCGGSASTEIIINPQVFVNTGEDVTILEGSSTTLSALATGGTEPFSFLWEPASNLSDPTSATPLANPSETTTFSVTITDAAGCSASDEVLVTVIMVQDDIHGRLTYMNEPMTPLNNCTVMLYQDGAAIASTITDNNGDYSFMNLPLGTYTLSAQTVKPWGGGNAADGLRMLHHFTGHPLLSGLKLQAGDVTGEGVINAHDALNTMRRFVNLLPDYSPIGDWVFENPTVIVDGYTTLNGDFQGLCMSDVNGDYLPSVIKTEPSLILNHKGSIQVTKGMLRIPVTSDQGLTIGAISLIFELPAGIDILDVSVAGSVEKAVFNQQGDELRVAWCSLNPKHLLAGEEFLVLTFNTTKLNGRHSLHITGSSAIADDQAEVIENAKFSIPDIEGKHTDLMLSNYPNPFSGSTQINYFLPEGGKTVISIFKLTGEKVADLVNDHQNEGLHQVEFDGSQLPQGVYLYKLELSSSGQLRQLSGRMNIIK